MAYASILVSIFDAVQRVDFLGHMMGVDGVIAFIRDWGWIGGVAWLAYLVLAPSKKETLHAVNAKDLRKQLARLLLRIERLSILYEMPEFDLSSHRAALKVRRRDLVRYSIADLLEHILTAVPDEFRGIYEHEVVAGTAVDLVTTPHEQLSALGREDEEARVTAGLYLYLHRHREKEQAPDQPE